MKVRITHLKAPWPSGALVGSVLEMEAVTPAFTGKCVEVGDDVEVTLEYQAPPPLLPAGAVLADAIEAAGLPAGEGSGLSDVEAQAASERAALEAQAAKGAKGKAKQ